MGLLEEQEVETVLPRENDNFSPSSTIPVGREMDYAKWREGGFKG